MEEQLTLPGTEEVQEDILSDINTDDFLNEMMGNENEATIEQEVFTEEVQSKDSTNSEGIKEESKADNVPQEESEQQVQSIDPSQVFEDKQTGNLITNDGTIVARAGRERREYIKDLKNSDTIQKQTQEINRLSTVEQQYKELHTKYNADNEALEKLGLNRDELFQSAQMYNAWKANPIDTINYLLTEARKLGHNIDGLSNGQQLDINAINKTIDEKLSPITNQYQQQQELVKQQQQTQQELNQFLSTHEYADIHGAHIAKLMTTSNMNASAAYWMLRQQATAAGLDFTKPLEPQAQQKLQGQSSLTTQSTNNAPGVGDLRGTNSSNLQNQNRNSQTPSMSFADIIKESMKENNFR